MEFIGSMVHHEKHVHHILSENNIVKILSAVFNDINIGWKQSFMSCGILLAVKVVYADFTFP